MRRTILITGGAGFIGSHIADELLGRGHRVRVLDSLIAQVHGEGAERPSHLDPEVELVHGDVRDPDAVRRALHGVDAVYHLAARVGVGPSMYEIEEYTDVNNVGTAVLLEALIERPVQRLIVASSMSVYGEGRYRDDAGRVRDDIERDREALARGDFEPRAADGHAVEPVATPEGKLPSLASVYALSKYDQERLCLVTGQAYDIPTVALRLCNVFGTRQARSNPYTGVLASFAARLLDDKPPLVFEDGAQRRDLVSVHDVARAACLALEAPRAPGKVFNIGSGRSSSMAEVAERLARALGKEHLAPAITGHHRAGDVRHCFADIALARDVLGFAPEVPLDDGLGDLAEWLAGQVAIDRVAGIRQELHARGLAL